MTRRKQILIAGLAAAAMLSVTYLAVRPTEAVEGIPVPVLTADLPAGSFLTADGVTMVRMSAESLPANALLSVEEVVGLRATVPLFEGEILLRERFSAVATGTLHPGAGAGRRIYALALKADDAAGWWLSEPSLDGGTVQGRVAPRGSAGAELMVLVALVLAFIVVSQCWGTTI